MSNRVVWVLGPLLGIFLVAVPSIGCGGGGGTSPASDCAPPTVDLTGTWEITEEQPSNTCGEPVPPPDIDTWVVTQVGNTLTATGSGGTRTFQICGNQVVVPGRTFPEDGGTTTVPTYIATFTNPTTWTGMGTWSWTNGVTSCTGTTKITAVRQ